MKKAIIAFSVVLLAAIACDKDNNTEPQPEPHTLPSKDTTTTGTITDTIPPFWCEIPDNPDKVAVELCLINAQTEGDFTFNIVKQLNNEPGDNFFLSPISVKMAFAMLANGADGESRKQILEAFGYGSKSIDELNNYCQTVISEWKEMNRYYANQNAEWSEYGDNNYQQTIETANAVWTDSCYPLFNEYIELCNSYFDAEATTLNFANKDSALAVMNGWCNTKTHGMIPSMLSDLDPLSITVMANALYFKADWEKPFKEHGTLIADFTDADGAVSQVDMMHQQEYFNYVRTDIFTMAELSYTGTTCMDIILPDSGMSVSKCISKLSQVRFDAALEKMSYKKLNVHLPKFDLEFNHNLVKIMNQLGVIDVFSPSTADLSKMGSGHTEAFVSDVFQLSHISVDENGTEAAAVTVMVYGATGVAEPPIVPIEFNVNRPFAYIIRDKQTGTILFVGKVEKM
ncbi:MAG: serpin family protein [Salinivirgaceae bacterium]|nr:serpin family protein [Salinivirgaceae bacterium]